MLAAASDPAKAASDIKHHVLKESGLGDDIQVVWNDGTVKVSGTAATQEAREKLILAAGNIQGVAKVEDAITVVAPAPAARPLHRAEGATRSRPSPKAVLQQGRRLPKIFKANQPLLKDPDHIYPGQVLRFPGASRRAASPPRRVRWSRPLGAAGAAAGCMVEVWCRLSDSNG